jgi:hypothetical protein
MRTFPGGDQPLGVDRGVDLRRRQVGVAQQFLDGAEIAPGTEKMRGERVPKSVRCRRFRKTKGAAQALNGELDDAG